jgi:hypothetical protein
MLSQASLLTCQHVDLCRARAGRKVIELEIVTRNDKLYVYRRAPCLFTTSAASLISPDSSRYSDFSERIFCGLCSRIRRDVGFGLFTQFTTLKSLPPSPASLALQLSKYGEKPILQFIAQFFFVSPHVHTECQTIKVASFVSFANAQSLLGASLCVEFCFSLV